MIYEVIVGNIGTVHSDEDEEIALSIYNVYVRHSMTGYGKVAGEPVTLMKDGEIVKEYTPPEVLVLTSLKMTCGACPSQWEGITHDGKNLYMRYRWGKVPS